jgi:hypothetical protein
MMAPDGRHIRGATVKQMVMDIFDTADVGSSSESIAKRLPLSNYRSQFGFKLSCDTTHCFIVETLCHQLTSLLKIDSNI